MTPKPKEFHKGCTGKSPFLTHSQAMETAKRMRNKHDSAQPVEAYHCVHCNRYHVGHLSKQRKRFKRAEALEVA